MRNIRNNKGFTLIELMIVVVIIGILAAIAIPKFTNVGNSAKEKEAEGVLKQIYTLQETYKVKHGDYATSGAFLADVGWKAPELKHYKLPSAYDISSGSEAWMQPSNSESSLRAICIDSTATFTYSTTVGGTATC